LPFAAILGFPWTFLTGNVNFLYRMGMWGAWTGVRLAGVKVETVGLEQVDPRRTYIYMVNHVSNLDPPIVLPLIPGRTSVMVKKELFKYPILGKIMRIGALVPVDRGNREACIAAVREASAVLRSGISMTIFVEGKRSWDGKLLPFKKGPFYLATEGVDRLSNAGGSLLAIEVVVQGLLAGAGTLERSMRGHGTQLDDPRGPRRVCSEQECEEKSHGFGSTIMGIVLVERTSPGLPSSTGRTSSSISRGCVETGASASAVSIRTTRSVRGV